MSVQLVFSFVDGTQLAFSVRVYGRSVGTVYLDVDEFERLLAEGFPITAQEAA